jgi:hypothetical protein
MSSLALPASVAGCTGSSLWCVVLYVQLLERGPDGDSLSTAWTSPRDFCSGWQQWAGVIVTSDESAV